VAVQERGGDQRSRSVFADGQNNMVLVYTASDINIPNMHANRICVYGGSISQWRWQEICFLSLLMRLSMT
jgi:hypothetical protein